MALGLIAIGGGHRKESAVKNADFSLGRTESDPQLGEDLAQ
jgi:hypothetical protein